ncbi:MAG: haloacid dehalogenase-like hydrolase [Neisseriaceae bacterium]|nr:haloacid dehalogenase-like hydrolase [Neisseriaceae bacterium]
MSHTPISHIDLSAWPEPAAVRLRALIRQHAHRGEYAVFDADQTCYQHDLTEPLLAFLEQRHVLSRMSLPPELKIVPFLDTPEGSESLYGYYQRLCDLSDNIGYAWIAQSFSGISLRQLKEAIDVLLAQPQPIAVRYLVNGHHTARLVHPPRMITGMQQLLRALKQHGIATYIVSAGLEEAVRMVLADPQYGYHVPAENIMGVTTLLYPPTTGVPITARQLITAGRYSPSALSAHKLSSHLEAPLTWYEGKTAAIKAYINPIRQPILVAGDTPNSDGPMLFDATDIARGGLRLFINRSPVALARLLAMQADRATQQAALNLPVTAHHNWLIMSQHLLG